MASWFSQSRFQPPKLTQGLFTYHHYSTEYFSVLEKNQWQSGQYRHLISWRINNTWVHESFLIHVWRQLVLMCMFMETRARCSNGYKATSGMSVVRNWILRYKKNDNLPEFWKYLDIWKISCYSNDIHLKLCQWLIWIFPEDNGFTFDKSPQIITPTHWRARTLTKWFSFKQPLDMGDKIERNYWR